jgi:hypothetical protein
MDENGPNPGMFPDQLVSMLMISKLSTGHSALDMALVALVPWLLRQLLPHLLQALQRFWDRIFKVGHFNSETGALTPCGCGSTCNPACLPPHAQRAHPPGEGATIDVRPQSIHLAPAPTHRAPTLPFSSATQPVVSETMHERVITFTQKQSDRYCWSSNSDIDKEPPNHLLQVGRSACTTNQK